MDATRIPFCINAEMERRFFFNPGTNNTSFIVRDSPESSLYEDSPYLLLDIGSHLLALPCEVILALPCEVIHALTVSQRIS